MNGNRTFRLDIAPVIAGGRLARATEAPWVVSVGVWQNREYEISRLGGHRGSGTLIAPRWVLTAAHCFKPFFDIFDEQTFELYPRRNVGIRVMTGTNIESPDKEIEATLVKVHPRFRESTYAYDLALVHLPKPLPDHVHMAATDVVPGECGVAAGWGETELVGDVVPALRIARAHVCCDGMCEAQQWHRVKGDPSLMFCVGGATGSCPTSQDAVFCRGDSGAGFVVHRSGRKEVCGVASWAADGAACTNPDVPQVFSRVSIAADWIGKQISG
jgi:secreted trypsin-like serine protease